MVFDVYKVTGLSDFSARKETVGRGDDAEEIEVFSVKNTEGEDKAFLVLRKNTLEVRTDRKLLRVLVDKYESVMESRYFGRGGIEIVNSGQLKEAELDDLVRLSYNLSAGITSF